MSNKSANTKIKTVRLPLDLVAYAETHLRPPQTLSQAIVAALRVAWGCPAPIQPSAALDHEEKLPHY